MKTVLVVREAGEFDEILRREGFATVNFAPIRTAPVEDFAELDARLDALAAYDGLFLTSPQAAAVFLGRWREKGAPRFDGRVYVLGGRVRAMFAGTSFELVFREEANTAEDLLNAFPADEFAGRRLLFLRGERASRTSPDALRELARLDETVLYRTLECAPDDEIRRKIDDAADRGELAAVCFFSPSGVDSFLRSFGAERLAAVPRAAIGATTARHLETRGLAADFVPSRATAKNFAVELCAILKDN